MQLILPIASRTHLLECGYAVARGIEQAWLGAVAVIVARAVLEAVMGDALDERVMEDGAARDVTRGTPVQRKAALDPVAVFVEFIARDNGQIFFPKC